MGVGHVMRCVALGQAWQERGGGVLVVTATKTPSLLQRILAEDIRATQLIADDVGGAGDLRETVTLARNSGCRWLVLDGYHFDSRYMQGVQAGGLRLMVVDDVADRDLGGVDVVLNHNPYATQGMYDTLTPQPRLLLGSPYTLLRREFLRQRLVPGTARERLRTLVTLGGADANNATLAVIRAFRQVPQPRRDIVFVIGQANPHLESLRAELPALCDHHDAALLVNPPDVPGLMASCDLAVTAAGSSCWELCCLGVPQIILVTADNQRLMPSYFRDRGIAAVFGALDDSRTGELAAMIATLLDDGETRRRLSVAARSVIDGGGAARIVDFLWGLA